MELIKRLLTDHQVLIGLAWVACGIAAGCGLGVAMSKRGHHDLERVWHPPPGRARAEGKKMNAASNSALRDAMK